LGSSTDIDRLIRKSAGRLVERDRRFQNSQEESRHVATARRLADSVPYISQ
jgi:hypothetical protein